MKQPPKSATSLISEKKHRISNSFLRLLVILYVIAGIPFFAAGQIRIDEVAKSWKYEEIYLKTPGDEFKRVGPHDIMTLRKGGIENTFSYALQLENIKAKGSWQLIDSVLIFTYQPITPAPSQTLKIRRFKIITLAEGKLVFREVLEDDKAGATFSYTLIAE